MHNNKNGFLLIECMLVLTLLGFLVGLSFSLTHLFDRLLVRSEVDLLINTIEAQRAIAVIDRKDNAIVFNKEQKYEYDTITHTFARSVGFVYPSHSYGPPSAPTSPIKQAVSFVDNKLICFATGAMSSGVLYIGSLAQNCFYALSSAIGEWGVLRLYWYDKNKWKKI